MKKTSFAYCFTLILLLACGCQSVEEVEMPETQPSGPRILTAVLESGPDTRTHLDGQDEHGIYYPYWSAGDELAVWADGVNIPDKFSLVDGSGTVKGSFSGSLFGHRMVGLYPYSYKTEAGLEGDVLTLRLSDKQEYAAGSFGQGAYPMLAVSESDSFSFKNLCSVLRVSMTGEATVNSIKFIAHDSWISVSGFATVRTDFQDVPELIMSDDGSNEVTLDCGFVPLDPTVPTDFFIVIPPGTYRGGFSLEIKTFTGTVVRSTDADIVFERSQVRSVPVFECIADGEIDPDNIPYNQIWYTVSNNRVFNPYGSFDRQIVSNTYEDGNGVIVFDGPVTAVRSNAFASSSITGVTLPNSIESIDSYAFYNSSITSFHTPDDLRSIGDEAFRYCYSLERIYGRHASPDEKGLILDDGTLAVYAVVALDADLVIPDGVKRISPYVFADCSSLETVTFPASVEEIGSGAFDGCTMLKELRGNNYHIPDNRSFVNPDGMLALWAGYGVTDYVIPPSVSYFESGLFCNNPTLHSLTFPKLSFDLVWNTDYFYGSNNLEFFYGEGTTDDHHCMVIWGNYLFAVTKVLPSDYTVPEVSGVYRTNAYLFQENTTVERLTMPDGISYIGNNFCRNMTKLKSVRMPAGLSSLGYNAFEGTTTLDTLYLRSFTPPSYDDRYGYEGFAHEGLVICVPEGFEELYKSSSSWSKYADYIHGYHYDDLPMPDYYISTDYSHDGEVTRLQKATKGRGIDVVLMGDAFSDRQIADGTYDSVMRKMADAFFSEEPYTTYRDLFNVYAVTVVSATEGYDNPGQALSGWFGEGTKVGGNDSKCTDYALNAVSEDGMDNTLIIVAMNSTAYAGTCWMYYPSRGDYGCGLSVAYFPIGTSDEGLAQLVHHEAGGHGFSKLDDEYAYDGTISQGEIDDKKYLEPYGWGKNVDFTDDPSEVKWSRFLTDERYKFDGLGVFEGACTYSKGAWRPTENSIMRHNTGGYNAPSREAIWYRIHKLAYGDDWNYDYEEFVAYDAVNRKTSAGARSGGGRVVRQMPPTHPPVIVPYRWNEVPETMEITASVR